MNKILLVGCGHMGSALLKAWFSKTDCSFVVIDPAQYQNINRNFNRKVKAFKTIQEVKKITISIKFKFSIS